MSNDKNKEKILNSSISYCTSQVVNKFEIKELKTDRNLNNIAYNDILSTLQSLTCFFEPINEPDKSPSFCISIKVTSTLILNPLSSNFNRLCSKQIHPCNEYNNFKCTSSTCTQLHVCKEKLKPGGCKLTKCGLIHTFRVLNEHNRLVFSKNKVEKFDPENLIKFYQVDFTHPIKKIFYLNLNS